MTSMRDMYVDSLVFIEKLSTQTFSTPISLIDSTALTVAWRTCSLHLLNDRSYAIYHRLDTSSMTVCALVGCSILRASSTDTETESKSLVKESHLVKIGTHPWQPAQTVFRSTVTVFVLPEYSSSRETLNNEYFSVWDKSKCMLPILECLFDITAPRRCRAVTSFGIANQVEDIEN